ncbi:MAG: hypothetical protein JW913_20945 [Chitinispirillaceae bacterium]|nr:hypothetical protein [Chitinispirillaceae bacterium]
MKANLILTITLSGLLQSGFAETLPDTVPRDASSSAIVASALLELCTYTGAPDSSRYFDKKIELGK